MTTSGERLAITEAIEQALDGGEPVAVATVTASGDIGLPPGAKLLVRRSGDRVGSIAAGVDEAITATALEQLTTVPRVTAQTVWLGGDGGVVDRRSQATTDAATVMIELFEAPARLVIVGGGHIGLALATMAEPCGFSVAVFDDREEFASAERFPMADYRYAGDIAAGLDGFDLDSSDYVVLVSRGHQVDELALRHVLSRGAAYVGMIGSRRRTHTVLTHLLEEGQDREVLEAVRTPIGIDIGAETPEEIAVSILAEIIMERRGGTGALMRTRRAPLGRPEAGVSGNG